MVFSLHAFQGLLSQEGPRRGGEGSGPGGNFSGAGANGVVRKWGSDGFSRNLTGLYFFGPVGVRLVPLKAHDFKGFDRILTDF